MNANDEVQELPLPAGIGTLKIGKTQRMLGMYAGEGHSNYTITQRVLGMYAGDTNRRRARRARRDGEAVVALGPSDAPPRSLCRALCPPLRCPPAALAVSVLMFIFSAQDIVFKIVTYRSEPPRSGGKHACLA